MSVKLLVVALACLMAAPAGVFEQDAGRGGKLYRKYGCHTCHGDHGQGGTAGSRLAPKPLSSAAFINYARKPSGSMPPYTEKVLSAPELRDIHAYLASIPPPKPVSQIPLLSD
jgi:mono/diheme cytochrome c family protein